MTLKAGIKLLVLILCLGFNANSQYISSGKITFERTNELGEEIYRPTYAQNGHRRK
jgi:hypothetical protein